MLPKNKVCVHTTPLMSRACNVNVMIWKMMLINTAFYQSNNLDNVCEVGAISIQTLLQCVRQPSYLSFAIIKIFQPSTKSSINKYGVWLQLQPLFDPLGI